MYRITLLIFSFLLFLNLVSLGQTSMKVENGLVWHTSIQEVHELSVKNKKPIFAFFTGSDWCGWCKRLKANVFAKQAFIDWANANVILLELDFPRGKILSPELTKQNSELQQALGVRGYPTIWLLYTEKLESSNTINLNTLGSIGYPQGAEPGKEEVKFLNDVTQITSKKK
jgi:thioredoxin-related protein